MQREYTYELPEGRVYVTIMPAKESDERWGDARVTVTIPFVEVSTKPLIKENGDRDTDAPWGELTFASQAYRVHDCYRPTTEKEKAIWRREGGPQPWTTAGLGIPYGGGIHRRSGTFVDYGSPARKKVNGVIMSALTSFALEVPDWEQRSIALHLEGQWQAACRHEEDLKGQMEAAVHATDKAKAALDAHLAKMEDR